MKTKAAVFSRSFVLLLFIFSSMVYKAVGQVRDLLICLEPTMVDEKKFEELISIGPKDFYVDPKKISSVDYIDSLLKLDFQSELDIIDSTFHLADSCLQFKIKGGSGGVSSYYVYSMGAVKDENGRDVIEVFFHYRNLVPPKPDGEKKLGISFYRLIGEQILQEPVIRLRTFKKTHEIPL